jgi:hypothetical protein
MEHFADALSVYRLSPVKREAENALRKLDAVCTTLYGHRTETGHGLPHGTRGEVRTDSAPADLGSASLLPVPSNARVDFITRVLERTMLYSGLTLFVLPERLHHFYLSYSYAGGMHVMDRDALARVLDRNNEHADLVAAGRCLFVPEVSEYGEESASGDGLSRVAIAPLTQTAVDLEFTPINLSELRPVRQPVDALLAYEQVVLPFFRGSDLRTIALIAEHETDAFRRFNRVLGKLLSQLPAAATPRDIEDLADELRSGVDAVKREARRVAALRSMRKTELGFFGLSITVAATHPHPAVTGVAGILGSVTLRDLVQKQAQLAAGRDSVHESEFYIPYLLDGGVRH